MALNQFDSSIFAWLNLVSVSDLYLSVAVCAGNLLAGSSIRHGVSSL